MSDHYDTLGVGKDASEAEIKRAYRKRAKEAHPDREGGNAAAMVAVNRAYETLSDKEKRARYDQTGSDSAAPTLQQRAETMLAQAFDQLLAGDQDLPAQGDPLQFLTKCFKEAIRAEEFEVKKAESYLEKLDRRAKRIKRKKRAGIDLWGAVIEDRRKRYEQHRQAHSETLAAAKAAMQMLNDEYEGIFEAVIPPEPGAKPQKRTSYDEYVRMYNNVWKTG